MTLSAGSGWAEANPATNAPGATVTLSPHELRLSWGWLYAHDKQLVGTTLSTAELALFQKGFFNGVQNLPAPYDIPKAYDQLLELAQSRRPNGAAPPTSAPAAPAARTFLNLTTNQLVEAWGWTAGHDLHADKFKLNQAEYQEITQGAVAAIQGKPPVLAVPELSAAVEQYQSDLNIRVVLAEARKRQSENQQLFASLKKNTNVCQLASGLCYQILRQGHGPHPTPNQRVRVSYIGRLVSGKIFEQTLSGPVDVDLTKVMRGWSEGLPFINPGGKLRLYIPPELAYGRNGTPTIPPDSTLIFDIDLLAYGDAEELSHPTGPAAN